MQQHKVSMGKRKFRIGDLARELKVKKYVVRFWEKEFELESDRSEGGQRFYTKQDLKTFLLIKDLLYNRGFTIAGAKKELEEKASKMSDVIVAPKDTKEKIVAATRQTTSSMQPPVPTSLQNDLKKLKKNLEELKRLLD